MDTSRSGEPTTTGHLSPAPPRRVGERDLVGRATELDALYAFVDDVAARGGALVLRGEVGVGKTALLDAAVGRARYCGAAVLRCRDDEARADAAFGALACLLRPIRHEVRTLHRRQRNALSVAIGLTSGPRPDRLQVCTATLAVLRTVGRERALLVAVDDLQDLDQDSARTLAFVARRLTGSRVGLLAATRSGDGDAAPPAGLAQLPVPPLRDVDAARLVRDRVPGLPAHLVRRVLAEAAGNPLALRELATTARAERFTAHPAHPVFALGPRLQERSVLADPARVSRREAASLDGAIRRLIAEPDPLRVTRVAALGLALDRVVECREPLRRALDCARDGQAVTAAITASALLCAGDVATGRWDEAGELAEEGIELCEQHGHRLAAAPLRLSQALMAAARGDEVRTRTLVDPVVAWAATRSIQSVVSEGRRVLALAALGRGDAEDAYRHGVAVTPPGRLATSSTAALQVSMDLVEAAVRLGRQQQARLHVQAMRDAPVHAVSPRFAMLTAASAALVAEPDEAAVWFEEALAAPDADRWPFDQARIQLAYGEHLRRQRRVAPSRMFLGAALDTFLRLGALPWAAQARHGLRATGVTIGRPVEPGAADLTPDERTAATLAAAGLTNKQIARQLMVSHHTVAARLYQAFPKLGVGSRAALRDAMLNLDGETACLLTSDVALGGIA